MIDFEILINTIALTVNNTFVGTTLAGFIIAYFGLKLYKIQKYFDVEVERKEKLHDLAVELLTHINVATNDYLGQISVHDGSNPKAKYIFTRMEEISPNLVSKEISSRFNNYISDITQAFNDLSTPLVLNGKNESIDKELSESIPVLNFLFSTVGTVPKIPSETLKDMRDQVLEQAGRARNVLEKIGNQ